MANNEENPVNQFGLDNSDISPLSSGGTSSPLLNTEVNIDDPTKNVNYNIPKIDLNDKTQSPKIEDFDSKNYIKNLVSESFGQVVEKSVDPYAYQKEYAYNPDTQSRQNQNFERYYSHSSFNKLGFNPWSDNESRYNEYGSKLGDVQRAVNSGFKLMYTGFTSPLRSYADILSGNPSGLDYTSAKEMSQLNTVGSSSRGGLTGFVSNLYVNSGYTVGLIGEVVLEDLALGLAAPETAGATLGLAGTRTVNAAKNLGEFYSSVKGLKRGLDNLRSFSAADMAYKTFKATGKFINPLENTVDALKAINESKNLTALAKASKTAGGFYRDIRSANLVLAESKMEGASTADQLRRDLTDKYYAEHGKSPDFNEQLKINQTAEDAGDNTLYANIPAIYLTNKITFDNMFKRFKNLDDYVTKYKTQIAFKKGVGFEAVNNNFKNAVKGLLKPKIYGKSALNYFKGNLSEGLQESIQEVISGAARDYYTNLYKNPSKQGLDYSVSEAISDNITKQFTGQGFETFASGFFMGGLIGLGGTVGRAAKEQSLRLSNKERYAQYKEKKDNYARDQVERLNTLYKDPLKYFGSNIINYSNTTEGVQSKNISSVIGSNKVWQDWDDQSTWSTVSSAFETGTYNIFLNHLDEISSMSSEAIKDAYGVDGAEVLNKIGKIKQRAEKLKDAYDYWNDKAPNPFNPADYKKDTPEYNNEAIAYYSWNQAKNHAIWYNYSFDRNQNRMDSLLQEITSDVPVAKVAANEFKTLTDPEALRREISLLKKEVRTLQSSPLSSTKKELTFKEKKLELLSAYRDNLQDYFTGQILEQTGGETEDIAALLQRSPEKLKESYDEYLKHLVKDKKGTIISKAKIDSTFEKIKDIHTLGQENVNLSGVINLLGDPEGFNNYHDRLNKVLSDMYENRSEQIKDSIRETQSRIETNAMLNTLYKRGFVVDANDIEKLVEKGEIPDTFYDTASKQVVTKESPQYAVFEAIVNDYLNTKKSAVVNPVVVPVTEEETTTEVTKKTVASYNINEKLRDVKNGRELEILERELVNKLENFDEANRLGLNSDIITKLIEAKKAELSKSFRFEDLEPGNVVLMEDPRYGMMVVKSKTSSAVKLYKLGESETTLLTVKKADAPKNIKYKYNEGMEGIEVEKLSADEQKLAKTNKKKTDDFMTNPAELRRLQQEAKKQGKEKTDEEFFNDLGCK